MNLKDLLQVPKNKSLILTLTGEPGSGKTTLACNFPKPVLIRSEDGLRSVPMEKRPFAFPLIKSTEDIMNQLTMLIKEEHSFQTLIIDSVTQLNTIFERSVIDSEPNKRKNATLASVMGGFGAGYNAVANLHQKVRNACELLSIEKGMNVVFIAHYKIVTIDLPDHDKFNRYELEMHNKSQAHYVNNVDVVAHLKQELVVTPTDDGGNKAMSTNRRVIDCTLNPIHVSKNRLGINEVIEFKPNENPFKDYI